MPGVVDLHITNPLTDPRWDEFVARHSKASAFHQRGWLQALALTYGYEPFVLSSSPHNQLLKNGIVLCRVSSWLTGKRLVSLPFADHCEPLVEQSELSEFESWLQNYCDQEHLKYAELRPRTQTEVFRFHPEQTFCFHKLDLSQGLDQLFHNLHKDSIQRKIRRAGKEGLVWDSGNSEQHVDEFYRMLLMTRRRHKLFPQPRSWFQNLIACMGDKIHVRLARKDKITVAAMLTLQHGNSVIYKYGCSDERLHHLGGMPFLFWRLIEESKAAGMEELDFGRSDLDNPGLITFKDRFGTKRSQVTYYRYSNRPNGKKAKFLDPQLVQWFFPILPDLVLCTGGRLLYKHMG